MHYNRVKAHGRAGVASPILNRGPRALRGWYITSNGYRKIRVNGGWVFEHRHVMEQTLGRPLYRNERVHHKNNRRTDNRPSNLELWVTGHPSGVRVRDAVKWAREILRRYAA